jgi:hypothetical protein
MDNIIYYGLGKNVDAKLTERIRGNYGGEIGTKFGIIMTIKKGVCISIY